MPQGTDGPSAQSDVTHAASEFPPLPMLLGLSSRLPRRACHVLHAESRVGVPSRRKGLRCRTASSHRLLCTPRLGAGRPRKACSLCRALLPMQPVSAEPLGVQLQCRQEAALTGGTSAPPAGPFLQELLKSGRFIKPQRLGPECHSGSGDGFGTES